MSAIACFVLSEAGGSRAYRIARAEFSVGGAPECGVRLADPGAPAVLCRVSHSAKGWVLEDAGSTTEIRVNGHPTKRWFLRPGDVIAFGEAKLAFEAEEVSVAPAPAPAAAASPAAPSKAAPSAPAVRPAAARHHPPAKRGLPGPAVFGISAGGMAIAMLGLFLVLRSGSGGGETGRPVASPADAFLAEVLDRIEREDLAPPSRPAARAYVKLCDEFLQRFPTHPKAAAVRGKRSTYAPVAMEWDPPTLQDAKFEARTNVRRHRYGAAKEALEDFLRRTPGTPDAPEAKGEIATIEGSAREHFEGRFDRCRDQLARAAFSVGGTRRNLLDQALAYLDEAEQAVAGVDAALVAKARAERDRIGRELGTVAGAGR